MANTSLTLGSHWETFIRNEVASGRYNSASEVVREALRELEERRIKMEALRSHLAAGEREARAGNYVDDFSMDELISGMSSRQRFKSVWDALGDSPEEVQNMQLRAELMTQIRQYVESLDMTQQAAAKSLGLTQPRLNELLHGRLDRFSLDKLVNVLARAGKHVTVTVSDEVA